MNIGLVIDWLNKEKGYRLSSEYYKQIDVWRDWWKGFYKPVHEYRELTNDSVKTRKLYTLKMAKKVCEDWSSILLNEKTEIVVEDDKSHEVLIEMLDDNEFWKLGNALVEKAFYSGTGAFVLRLENLRMTNNIADKSSDVRLGIEFLPAHNIIPITIRRGKIIEVAFVSEVYEKGDKFIYLEMHELKNGKYVISNRYFKADRNALNVANLPDGMLEEVTIATDIPMFAIISPNVVNTHGGNNGLGMSIYAHALDNLEGVDLAYNNFNRDLKLGGKKVFYSDSLVRIGPDGNKITPDDMMQQLFSVVGEMPLREDGKNSLMTEYNPDLRVTDDAAAVQAQLDYLSFKCGFGTKHYQFNGGTIVTATQYSGDKQELVQNASKHYIVMETALKQLSRAILWACKELRGDAVNPDAEITINFEDSYIIDKESERQRDLQEVRDGIMKKYEYRMKWYGESEEEAKKILSESQSNDDWLGFEGGDA